MVLEGRRLVSTAPPQRNRVMPFENAIIGQQSSIEPDVAIGFRYHPDCGPAVIGRHAILRAGTIIYGDVQLGDYFQSGHYAVIRAMVRSRGGEILCALRHADDTSGCNTICQHL